MAESYLFDLWLEFECYPPDETYDPVDDFASISSEFAGRAPIRD